MTVLLVDDDEDDREIFRDAMTIAKPGCHLLFACDGEDGLLVLKGAALLPDVIFVDVNMPKMDGKQFLKTIKADPGFQKIPVVMYSTSSHKTELGEYFRIGASNYITKPSEFGLLVTFLKSILH